MAACSTCGRDNRAQASFCDGCGSRLAAPALGLPPARADQGLFVGRERELTALRKALAEAAAGTGSIALLSGEPGIGKTRTAEALAREALDHPQQFGVFWGRCQEEPGAPPYWPWLQLMRAYLEAHPGANLSALLGAVASDVAEILPELAQHIPDAARPQRSADAAQARFRLFDGIEGFWKRAGTDQPLLLILDNVHWADVPSLRLLEFLAPEIGRCRLLVLCTYRDIALTRSHPLSNTLGELARYPRLQRLRLSGLQLAETQQFMRVAAQVEPAEDLVQQIHAQTDGNPLFVAEMTRFLVQEGVLGEGAPKLSARLAAVGGTPRAPLRRIPEGIKEAIGTRLNRLTPTCNQVLAHAAVIGRSFSFAALAGLFEHTGDELSLALEEALAAAVIEALDEPGQYQFSHALTRETLYDEIPAIRRSRLHMRMGAVLEQLHEHDLTAHLSTLAHHHSIALPGGDVAKALEYAGRAAQRADSLFAYEESARYHRLALQALQLAGGVDRTRRCQLQIELAVAQTKAGENLEAAQLLQQAAADAKELGVADDLARAAVAFEEATWRPGMPGNPAVQLLNDALAGLGEEDSPLKAQVLSSLTRALIFSGALDEATRVHERALAMAHRLGDAAALAAALGAVVSARWLPGEFPRRVAVTLEALRLAQQVGDKNRYLEAASWRMFDLMELGDRARAAEFETSLLQQASELRQPFYQYTAAAYCAMLALFEGRFEDSEQFARAALQLGQRMPSLDAAGIFGVQMFSLRRVQGRLKELAPLVQHIVRSTPEAALWRPGLALLLSELDLRDEARAEFEVLAQNDFAAIPRDGSWSTCCVYLAEVCAYLGDGERAATLYALLEPCAGRNIIAPPNVACFGAATHFLGMLAATMQKWSLAQPAFEAALELNMRQGAKPSLAFTQYQYAVMLLRRGETGDRERARALLQAAEATSGALGMATLRERSADVQLKLTAEPERLRYPAGLSQREVEVLRLVAAGKNNREVAQRLFVSPNTVANHVRAILTKTETSNRTEAAAFAFKHDLLKG